MVSPDADRKRGIAASKALDKTFFRWAACVIVQSDVPSEALTGLLARFS
ncbi:MAG: hypothetical protein QUV35_14660 [Hydrogenophaga sp.]|nr:hypothetical protein [Hydrogenophaga sp.]MDM7943864.1 hypothetical protein [Hydrogenophaga sp.]